MKKNILWMFVAVIFAVGSIFFGVVYANNRQEKLLADINNSKKTQISEGITSNSDEENLKQDRGKIVYSPMGDSLTEGYFASSDDTRFAKVYAKMLEDKLGYQVDTQGVAGYGGVSGNGVNGLSEIKEQNPDLVTIEFGTNDSDPKNGSSLSEFEENITTIIDELSSMDNPPQLVLVTTWNQGDKAKPFDEYIKKIGNERGIPVADISSIWADSSTKGPAGKDTFKGDSDNWHPNDDGMERIAQQIYDVSYKELIT